jgi:hypothetical protein
MTMPTTKTTNEGNLNDSAEFRAFLHRQFSKDVEEKVMTLGQQAVQQEAGKTALRMLEEKFDIELTSKMTKLSPEEIKVLAKKKNN